MDHLQEIKSRLPIEELVGSYVQLKKAGRNLKGLCPFHHEKTPSFMVSPEKELAYCFGCNQGGDIFKFTQLVENCDFGEAMKLLAERTGVPLPRTLPKFHNKRLRVLEMNEAATEFFKKELNKNPDKKEYFLKRGFAEKTIHAFSLGYAPKSFTALKEALLKKGFTETELLEAGLLNQRSLADKSSYDRFRDRLIFPIFDHQGNAVGFGGRVMDNGEPKYLNSPETPAYHKSFVLYGLNWAKESIKEKKTAILMEGYMDVIMAHQAGTTNAVGTSGTALTPEQLKLIKRYTNRVAFAFDQDSAGLEATFRAIELTQLSELDIQIIAIPVGKDPDECIKADPAAWEKAVLKPISIMDFYFNYGKKLFDPETLEGKKGLLRLLLPLIKQYPTEMEQGYHLQRLALELKTDINLLWNDMKKIGKQKIPPWREKQPEGILQGAPSPIAFSREMYLLGFLFQYPELGTFIFDNLIDTIPFDPETKRFYNACKNVYKEKSGLVLDELKAALSPEDSEKVDIYRLLVEEHYPDLSEEAIEREAQHLIRSINRQNLHKTQKEYELKIRAAGTPDEKNLLLNQYNEILKLTSKL